MLSPKSYTREDVVELQCHGNEVCLRRVLRACLEAGARLAEPGCLSRSSSVMGCKTSFIFVDISHIKIFFVILRLDRECEMFYLFV